MNKFYTGIGDNGFSCGIRKDSKVFELLGSLDELQTFLGFSRVIAAEEFYFFIEYLQHCIFKIQAQIYNFKEANKLYITKDDIDILEKQIEKYSQHLLGIDSFTLTGSSQFEASIDYARTLCRKAERHYISYSEDLQKCPLKDKLIKQFLNRLSSVLFVISRYYNRDRINVNYNAKYIEEK